MVTMIHTGKIQRFQPSLKAITAGNVDLMELSPREPAMLSSKISRLLIMVLLVSSSLKLRTLLTAMLLLIMP